MKNIHYIIPIFILILVPPINGFGNKINPEAFDLAFNNLQDSDTLLPANRIIIDSFELELLPPSSGVHFFKEGLIFLAPSKSNKRMIDRHLSFGNIGSLFAAITDSGLYNPSPFFESTSIPIPPDGLTFKDDYSVAYYSKLSKDDGRVRIYQAKSGDSQTGIEWIFDELPLGFCMDNNYSHPALSFDGNIMIFSSDMPESTGGMDLFIVHLVEGGWSSPEKLKSGINSPGNELFAFLDDNNNLFFASDGLEGLGGFDVFFSRYNGTDWESPMNLTGVINSEMDEVAFTLSPGAGKEGFFTTRDRSGKGGMQLYRIKIDESYYAETSRAIPEVLYSIALSELNLTAMERSEAQRIEAERLEQERLAAETLAAETLLAEQQKAERLAAEKLEADRMSAEKLDAERLAAEILAAEKLASQKREADEREAERIAQQNTNSKEVVTYRVQFIANTKSKGRIEVTIDGTTYRTREYYYKGGWRMTIGDFSNIEDAITLQGKCRKEGYGEAFVAAFVNGTRSLDMSLFKR
ncbi:MAG: hypothetical protein E4G95_05590 [Bacteroidia bacterium]|nr:MAG: hypothetical protein E4G95_05590 [Bacteroidia bacterium]